MDATLLWALAGLQVKHFVADYTLQWPALIADKRHLNRPGGYLHAGIHAILTLPVLVFCALPAATVVLILAAEFVFHYAIDYTKASLERGRAPDVFSRGFWITHGTDQLAHQLTYAAILAFIHVRAG